MIRKYESCFLLKVDLSEEDFAKEVQFIEDSILKSGAKIVKKEMWGRKMLAYPIKKKNEAIYYLFFFEAQPDAIAKIEENFTVRENILRHIFLTRKHLPEEVKEVKEVKEVTENGGTTAQ